MIYGNSVGKKFYEDGSVRRFPGNTVVAPIQPGCSAYDVMVQLRRMFAESDVAENYILLPPDSYHMTVLDWVCDQVRDPEHWPEGLPLDAPMEAVDAYISKAVAKVPMPGGVKMKFDRLNVSKNAVLALLKPANKESEKALWDFRNAAAHAVGLHLPNHETYRFHISLAYTRVVPEGEKATCLEKLTEEINEFLQKQAEFVTGQPYMAYFDDMLKFSPETIKR